MWEMRESLPRKMKDVTMVEMNGLIYVVGKIKNTQNHASNFWCYNPNKNVWSEKAQTTLGKQEIVLLKVS